jgi:hypothetical protein
VSRRRQPLPARAVVPPPSKEPASPWPHRVLGGLLCLAMFLACCFPLSDTDLFWHLKTGEWILANGQVPFVDLYTFTNAEQPWIDLHWGFQVLMATVHRLGGSALVVTLKALVLTAALWVGWSTTGRNLPAWLRALPWCLALLTLSGRGYERPEIFTVLFLATWLWLLERVDERPSWAWWLPALQVLWINVHALFVLGLVVGGCRVADELLRQSVGNRWGLAPSMSKLRPRQAVYVIAGCLAAAFVNPYFEQGALFPLVLYRKFNVEQAFYAANIGEFRQPVVFFQQFGFDSVYLNAELALWCVAAFSFVVLAIHGRRWSPHRLLLFAGFSHLAWEASRNTNIFSIVAATVACGNFSDWWLLRQPKPGDAPKPGFSKSRASPSLPSFSPLDGLVAAALLAFTLTLPTNVWHRWTRENQSFGFGERAAWFPHAAAKFAGQPGFPAHAFAAHFGVASVYSYHNGPDRTIFMDGRLEVCTQQTFEAYNAILHSMTIGDPRWESSYRDKEGRLPVVLLDSRTSRGPINGLLQQPQWRLVFADPSCAVFLETAQAEKLKLPAVSPEPLLVPPGMRGR